MGAVVIGCAKRFFHILLNTPADHGVKFPCEPRQPGFRGCVRLPESVPFNAAEAYEDLPSHSGKSTRPRRCRRPNAVDPRARRGCAPDRVSACIIPPKPGYGKSPSRNAGIFQPAALPRLHPCRTAGRRRHSGTADRLAAACLGRSTQTGEDPLLRHEPATDRPGVADVPQRLQRLVSN